MPNANLAIPARVYTQIDFLNHEPAPQPTEAEQNAAVVAAAAAEVAAQTADVPVVELPFSLDAIGRSADPLVSIPEQFRGSNAASRAYISTQPINDQIAQTTRDIESVHARSGELLTQRQTLSAIISTLQNAGKKGPTTVDLTELQVRDASGTTMSAAAMLERVGLLERFTNDGKARASIDSLTTFGDELRSATEQVNSSTQMTMLQMQELMHQKNLLLQLASTELSSREQLERRIAENIR